MLWVPFATVRKIAAKIQACRIFDYRKCMEIQKAKMQSQPLSLLTA